MGAWQGSVCTVGLSVLEDTVYRRRVYSIHTAQVGCYKSCIKCMYCFKVFTRSVHSVCSGGLGFVVLDTGQFLGWTVSQL